MRDLLDHCVEWPPKNSKVVANEVVEQSEKEEKFTPKQDLRYLSPTAAAKEESFFDTFKTVAEEVERKECDEEEDEDQCIINVEHFGGLNRAQSGGTHCRRHKFIIEKPVGDQSSTPNINDNDEKKNFRPVESDINILTERFRLI